MLEIPYNFDTNLINLIDQFQLVNEISYIYCPTFFKDSYSTLRSDQQARQIMSLTRDEYEGHINFLHYSSLGDRLQLILQDRKVINNLDYYINLGFTSFCVNNLTQAKIIKEINPEFQVIGSITLGLTEAELYNNIEEYKKYFNGLVLMFPFNRDIEAIKKLPKDLYYIIIVNNRCSVYCDGLHHWFGNIDNLLKNQFECPVRSDNSWDHITTIMPWDLPVFDPYIKYYKIQGRGLNTNDLIKDILMYSTQNNIYYKNLIPDETKYIKRW